MIKPERLYIGDTIGIIAPSRPATDYVKEINAGMRILERKGFRIKLGSNLYKKYYYSAGSPQEKAFDMNDMFCDKKVKAIICAAGGITSNQILNLIDFESIKNNPKIFLGHSDISTFLLSIYKETESITFHGINLCGLKKLNVEATDFLFDILMGQRSEYCLPLEMTILKKGKAKGKLLGGNLHISNSLLGTEYLPSYNKAIWFWEEVEESPACIDHKLQQFKLSGNLEKISAMVIGNLSKCRDEKNESNNRPIEEIVLELTKGYNFPIIKVPYFGHDTSDFYTFPIGAVAEIDTAQKKFKIIESPVQ